MEDKIQDPSSLNPLALGLLLTLASLIWVLPRRQAFSPVLIMIGLMPMGQQIVVMGLHFHLFRILLLCGLLRVVARGEFARLNWTGIDRLFVGWIGATVVMGSLSKPSTQLLINRLGDAYNALGCYFFARCVLAEFDDVVASVRALAYITLPIAAFMLVENRTSHNLLAVFGGVSEITAMRDGHLRCQGAFRHPILAGVFGATQFPLFAALWWYDRRSRKLAALAMVSSLAIIGTAHSSGGLLAFLSCLAGLALWRFRKAMPWLRWGSLAAIIGLAMVMKAPVWYLLARMSEITGGTGWHRAWLIDQAIGHFDEWWLFGTTFTAHWGPAGEVTPADPNMMDITNHYIMEGVKGGILKLGLFLAIIVACFRALGRRLGAFPAVSPDQFLVWAMGVSFFAHCLSFISANYFDQTVLVWFWLEGAIVCVAHARSTPAEARTAVPIRAVYPQFRYRVEREATAGSLPEKQY
ncbi:O-antigen ligase family protein [Methylomicrobium agile]|uniref:O-antigen ligase family protein n=1 Tax=Methylomicrobium agile TaxID=39774 RepID=UPI0004DF51AD|nr:hypothetical protein [Methylomicrobium agile]